MEWVLANATTSSVDPALTFHENGVEPQEPDRGVSHVIVSVNGDAAGSFTKAGSTLVLNLDILTPSLDITDTNLTSIVGEILSDFNDATPTGSGYAFTPLFFNAEASGGRATGQHRVYRLSFTTVAIAGNDGVVTSSDSGVNNFGTGVEVFAFSLVDSCQAQAAARPSEDSLRTYRPSNPDTNGQLLVYHLGGVGWQPPQVAVYPDVQFVYDANYSRTLNILVTSVRVSADARDQGGPLVWACQFIASQDYNVGSAYTMPASDWAR